MYVEKYVFIYIPGSVKGFLGLEFYLLRVALETAVRYATSHEMLLKNLAVWSSFEAQRPL